MTDEEIMLLIDRCRTEGRAYEELNAVREAAKAFSVTETAAALRAVSRRRRSRAPRHGRTALETS